MPHVINGIGTWYNGKRNIHRLRGVCSECSAVGDLLSYDTTLFFVVVFIPLIPLRRRRVLDECPSCGRHRVVPLHVWEKAKADGLTGATDRLRADPADRDAIVNALQVAASFQDEPLLAEAADAVAAHRPADAGVLATLGDVNGYFARHDAAAAAYIESLKAADDPRVSEQLGLTLLKLGNPAAAAGCFDHVLADADGERLWMLYQLAVAYQAKGMHAEALDLLDRVDKAFPAVAANKDWRKLRAKSEKDRGRGRPVGKSLLLEGPRAGVRPGSRLKWLLPRLALPLILLSFAGWHTWRSLALAAARPMYLLNGSPRAYTVAVNGTDYTLSPGVARPVELPEGTLTIAPGQGADGVEPAEVRVGSSFWARPYDGTRLVVNPDRLAVLVRETTVYATPQQDGPPDAYLYGQALHEVAGIDHCFEPFPNSVQAKRGQSVTRTRLAPFPVTTSMSRVSALGAAGLSAAEQAEYGRRWLAIDPADGLALGWFAGTVPAAEALPVFKTRLGDRPLRVEWHRAYQTVSERAGGDPAALRGEYVKLADEARRDPDALYLLARVSERGEGAALLQEAIDSGRPAGRAHYAVGYRKLCEGDFPAAAAAMDRAGALARDPAYQPTARDALLAAGRTRDLLARLAEDGTNLAALLERARVCEIAGDKVGADAAAAVLLAQVPAQSGGSFRSILQKAVATGRAAARGDVVGYLAAVGPASPDQSVADALLRGGPADALAAKSAVDRALILLAAPPEGVGAAKQGFLDALADGDRDERLFKELLERADGEALPAVREAAILPSEKRVYAAAAAVWFPAEKAQLVAFARTLDFERDVVSLALRKSIGATPAKGPARPVAPRAQ